MLYWKALLELAKRYAFCVPPWLGEKLLVILPLQMKKGVASLRASTLAANCHRMGDLVILLLYIRRGLTVSSSK